MPSDYPLILARAQRLVAHPACVSRVVSQIEVQILQHSPEEIVFAYCLWGDMARLCIPPPDTPEKRDLLWEHTCFEAFVTTSEKGAEDAYREFNFSPCGAWACYDFSAYRNPCKAKLLMIAPRIETHQTEGRLELKAFVPTLALGVSEGSTFHVGLTAVIETRDVIDDARSYWALAHPAERPDFHHPDSFTLSITTGNSIFKSFVTRSGSADSAVARQGERDKVTDDLELE